jgi:serine/threonine protein kinase
MPQANERVGEYVLIEPIGGGAFGQVWKAHHHVWTEQLVAVKIPSDRRYLSTLQSEGVVINGLVHPNIVKAIAFDPYAEVPYLVMEYVPGSSLRPLIRPGGLPVDSAVAILKQVLMGLSYAHGRKLVHRDIKPENILVREGAAQGGFSQPGCVKITDFGLGRLSMTGGSAGAASQSIAFSMTLDSPAGREIAGTIDYMAPEQRGGGAIDCRADLYACGVVLYELLTGEKPAGAEVPSDLNPRSPKALDVIFRRSFARLDKRFASADEFLAALGSTVAAPPPLPTRPPAMKNNVRMTNPPSLGMPGTADRKQCPRCRAAAEAGDQFCMHCGTQLVENVRRCPQCGGYPDRSDAFCMFCGQSLASVTPAAQRPVQGG